MPLIRLYPALQRQVAPFQAELAPQEGAEGSHWLEAVLKMYPAEQLPAAAHFEPSQLVPEGQAAQALTSLWKYPEEQVQETPLKKALVGQEGMLTVTVTH